MKKPARSKARASLFGPETRALLNTWRVCLPPALVLAAAVLWIYGPAMRGGWIWDDTLLIPGNALNRDLAGLGKIWTAPGALIDYYPVTFTVQWFEWQYWHLGTLGYHVVSVALHLVNALLVWRLLAQLGVRLASVGALLFAIHPLQVESVAWISELKNVLSLAFYLGALLAYLDFDKTRATTPYVRALVLFIVAILCKTTVLTFPLVILLYSWWKRGRIGIRDVKAAAPFFAVAVALGVLSVALNRVAPQDAATYPVLGLAARLVLSGECLAFYVGNIALPLHPLAVYPQWPVRPVSFLAWMPWLAFVALAVGLWSQRATWGRHALLGLGFFVISITPFLGLVTAPNLNFTWVMDHFVYFPVIGLVGLLAAALGELIRFRIGRVTATIAIVVISCTLAAKSRAEAKHYLNGEAFWTHVLRHNPGAWVAEQDLAQIDLDQQRNTAALVHADRVVQLQPAYADGHLNRAIALDRLNRDAEAEEELRTVLRLQPNDAEAYLNLGELKRKAGDSTTAEALFRQGLAAAPEDAMLNIDLAGLRLAAGKVDEALDLYSRAAAARPDLFQAQYDLGVALERAGRLPDAADHLRAAVQLDPSLAAAHKALAVADAQLGHLPEAMDEFNAALNLDPDDAATQDNLALALAQLGRISDAEDHFRQALQVAPGDARAADGLAKLQAYEARVSAQP